METGNQCVMRCPRKVLLGVRTKAELAKPELGHAMVGIMKLGFAGTVQLAREVTCPQRNAAADAWQPVPWCTQFVENNLAENPIDPVKLDSHELSVLGRYIGLEPPTEA